MGNRIYVGNLAYSITTQELRNAFSGTGTVTDAVVMSDRETGQSRGFGFVTFACQEDAASAISSMAGVDLGGRKLVVNEAKERTPGGPPQSSAGGFNSGGGYSSDGGQSGARRPGGGGARKPDGGGGRKGGRRERDRDNSY